MRSIYVLSNLCPALFKAFGRILGYQTVFPYKFGSERSFLCSSSSPLLHRRSFVGNLCEESLLILLYHCARVYNVVFERYGWQSSQMSNLETLQKRVMCCSLQLLQCQMIFEMFEGKQEHQGTDDDDVRSIYVSSTLCHFYSNHWGVTLSYQTVIPYSSVGNEDPLSFAGLFWESSNVQRHISLALILVFSVSKL